MYQLSLKNSKFTNTFLTNLTGSLIKIQVLVHKKDSIHPRQTGNAHNVFKSSLTQLGVINSTPHQAPFRVQLSWC